MTWSSLVWRPAQTKGSTWMAANVVQVPKHKFSHLRGWMYPGRIWNMNMVKHKYWSDLGPATESSLWTESTSNRWLDVNSFSDLMSRTIVIPRWLPWQSWHHRSSSSSPASAAAWADSALKRCDWEQAVVEAGRCHHHHHHGEYDDDDGDNVDHNDLW